MNKSKTYEPLQLITLKASANLSAFRFIGFNGAHCQANKKSAGISELAWKSGDNASVVRAGTMLLEIADAVTTIGQSLKSNADGKGIPALTLSVDVPAGSVNMQSQSSDPDFVLQGGILPEFINAYALETGLNGDIIKVALV